MTDSKKLDLILEKVDSLDKKADGLDKKVDSLDKKVDSLDKKVDSLDKRVTNLEDGMAEVRQRTAKLDMTIENEIRVNIQRVAEGHLDLSRKLDKCISMTSDVKAKQEVQDIYLNMHTNQLKALG